MDKKRILANVDSLTAEQLLDEIKKGTVSLDELKNTGSLSSAKRKIITESLAQFAKDQDEAWESVRNSNEISKLEDFISAYPNGKYQEEAKRRIDQLERVLLAAVEEKNRILRNLQDNPKAYYRDAIFSFLKSGKISKEDLVSLGIPNVVIESLNSQGRSPRLGNPPESVPDGYKEVYFWGMTGSGKTTALAALLKAAEIAGIWSPDASSGYDYMIGLKNIFNGEVGILPPPTNIDKTQYLPFTLRRPEDKGDRSVSLIELSGEIFQCFYYKNAGMELLSDDHRNTFETLHRFLNGNNRKIHFFFIDYSTSDKLDAYGYTQGDYLQAASTYFNNNKIFDKRTDVIYVIITKSDLMDCPPEGRAAFARDYLKEANFIAFMNTLKQICKKYSINGGKLYVEPFSLGKVYWRDICHFDPTYANNLLEILIEWIPEKKSSFFDFFNQ